MNMARAILQTDVAGHSPVRGKVRDITTWATSC